MKKLLSMVLVLLMAMTALTACSGGRGDSGSGGGGSEPVSVDSLKTIGDVIALECEEKQSVVYENKAVYAFKLGDTYYRATAAMTPEDFQAYIDIDFMDEDYEDQQNAIVAPLEIDEIENLSDQILSQADLDALTGKTGQELQDAGWTYSGHNLESMEFWMNYGPFMYTVTFDGEVAESEYETFEDEAGTADMKVKSAVFLMMGDNAAN